MTDGVNKVPNYQSLLEQETRPVPEALLTQAPLLSDSPPPDTSRYLSREFYEREKQMLWPRVWQATCRESEVDRPGDFSEHQIADVSIIIVRTEAGELRAYYNACLHRGRQLKTGRGNSSEIKCPYHGFRWALDGAFLGAPCQWDFPHIEPERFSLPQLRVDTWGGWVFVNQSDTAPTLGDYLGIMARHFERWQPENTFKAMHLKKVLYCNWKVAHEAFIESYHTVATHPQLLPYTGDVNSQYDCFNDHVSRTITPMGIASPHLPATTEQESVNQWLSEYGLARADVLPAIPDGVSARHYLGEMNIARFSRMYGRDLSALATHSEVLDAILYSVFPNFAPWGGFRPNVTYRFLPWEDRHDMCSMEIMLLMRFPPDQERPRDVPATLVGPDQAFADVESIEPGLARVFDQDFGNLPQVQRGLESLASGRVQLGRYQESRIRHFHQTLDKYMNSSEDTI